VRIARLVAAFLSDLAENKDKKKAPDP